MANYYEPPVAVDTQSTENKLVNTALTPLPKPYISGLKLQADVKINELVLNTIDSSGVVWVVTDIEGWWNLPDSEIPDLARGWGDGSYDALGRYGNRIITLSGSFLTQSPDQVPAARQKFLEAVNLVKTGAWLVVNETPAKASYVRLSGTPSISTVKARGRTDFSVGFKAVDPIKYAYIDGNPDGYDYVDIAAGHSATVTNAGNTPVPVVFATSGALHSTISAPATIKNTTTNKIISIIDSTTSLQSLEIDTRNREILLVEGDSVTNGRAKGAILVDWMYLEPGANTIEFKDTSTPSGSSASCRVYWRSGWIG